MEIFNSGDNRRIEMSDVLPSNSALIFFFIVFFFFISPKMI